MTPIRLRIMRRLTSRQKPLQKELDRLMTTSTYKGKDIFVTTAGSEYVSMGGRDSEMTFGIGEVDYSRFTAVLLEP